MGPVLLVRWLFGAGVLASLISGLGCSDVGDRATSTVSAAETLPSELQPESRSDAGSSSSAITRDIRHVLIAETSELDTALAAVVKHGSRAIVPFLECLQADQQPDRVLTALERIEVKRFDAEHPAADFWSESELIASLNHDSRDVRTASRLALELLYERLPDRLGLVLAIRTERNRSRYWDTISLVPEVLEHFAIIEVRQLVDRQLQGQNPDVDERLERILAIREPARLELQQVIAALDPSGAVLAKEFQLQQRKQDRLDRWRRRMTGYRAFILPPENWLTDDEQQLDAIKQDAARRQEVVNLLTAALLTLRQKRNIEMLVEARPLVPDPEKITVEFVRSDAAVADILLTAAEGIWTKASEHPRAGRLLFDSLAITPGAQPPRLIDRTLETANQLATLLDILEPTDAESRHEKVLVELEKLIAAGDPRSDELTKLRPLVISRGAECAWRFSNTTRAISLQERVVEEVSQADGLQSVGRGVVLSRLAAMQAESDDATAALANWELALEILRGHQPQAQVPLIDAVSAYSACLIKSDAAPAAEELVTALLNEVRRVQGDTHYQTARLLSLQGRCCLAQGDVERAVQLTRNALELMAAADKQDSQGAATAHEILGESLWEQGQRDAARKEWESCRAIRLTYYGDRHPSTRRILELLRKADGTTEP